MPVIGITGGIAAGKSTFTVEFARRVGGEVFDADLCARELTADEAIVDEIRNQLGPGVITGARVDRVRLRDLVFRDDDALRRLESILHPMIRERWLSRAEEVRLGNGCLLVDIPLLYETHSEEAMDAVVVVACADATQRERLRRRGLYDELASKIIDAQLPMHIKIRMADHVVWNDSTKEALARQAEILAKYFSRFHG